MTDKYIVELFIKRDETAITATFGFAELITHNTVSPVSSRLTEKSTPASVTSRTPKVGSYPLAAPGFVTVFCGI